MQAPKLILGLRELPRPVGEGYLYYKRSLKEDDKILLFSNLYNTTEAELEGLFRQAITSIIKKENLSGNDVQGFLSSYSTENMRQWTQEVLARVVSLFMDPEYQRGSRIT
jgi:hypothetical protein